MSQLKVNSIVPAGGLPSGSNGGIIQCIQAVKTDEATLQTTTFTDITGLSATITPSSSSNKILCDFKIYLSHVAGLSAAKVNLVRGSTNIAQPFGSSTHTASMFHWSNATSMWPVGMNFLDSPATTSATTYKIQVCGDTSDSVIAINRYVSSSSYLSISTLTLYEVSV